MTTSRNDFFNRPQYRNLYRGNDSWRHAPEHRRGVAYGNAVVRQQYVNVERRSADARREIRASQPVRVPGREAPRTTIATPQPAPAYRQAPVEARNAPALRAPQSVAVPAGQAAPQVQASPQWRAAPPAPTMPRVVVPAPQPQAMSRTIVPAPQPVPAPGMAVREAPQAVPAPAERGRIVRQSTGPGPADAGDSGPQRGR